MAVFLLQQKQIIPAIMDEVWQFISSPANLKHITPDYMGFDMMTPNLPEKMYPGMIITYKVSPLLGIKTTWVPSPTTSSFAKNSTRYSLTERPDWKKPSESQPYRKY